LLYAASVKRTPRARHTRPRPPPAKLRTMSDSPPPATQVWVDADACPGPIKEILFRAAERARVPVTLVANQWLKTPGSRFVRALQVQGGFDAADDAIAERAGPGDLVVTQDIPLAARVLARG